MKFFRFMLEVLLGVILSPAIVFIEVVLLICCIRAARYLGESAKEGVKVWLQYLKAGLEMNKDFVINGL